MSWCHYDQVEEAVWSLLVKTMSLSWKTVIWEVMWQKSQCEEDANIPSRSSWIQLGFDRLLHNSSHFFSFFFVFKLSFLILWVSGTSSMCCDGSKQELLCSMPTLKITHPFIPCMRVEGFSYVLITVLIKKLTVRCHALPCKNQSNQVAWMLYSFLTRVESVPIRGRESLLFLKPFPRARFETDWNTDKCVSSILS